jgi:hypothetical protein
MSIGLTGLVSSLAAQPLSQPASDAARSAQESSSQARAADSNARSTDAAGIGTTSADEQTGDRDADGRRPWEIRRAAHVPEEATTEPAVPAAPVRDPKGVAGTKLDLTG